MSTPLEFPLGYTEIFPIVALPTATSVGSVSAKLNLTRFFHKTSVPVKSVQCDIEGRSLQDLSITAAVSQRNVTATSIIRPASTCVLQWFPTITYALDNFRGFNHVKATVNVAEKSLGASVEESAYRASIVSKVLDGFASEVSLSTRLVEQVYSGLYFSYDPSRSGLKDYRYSLLFRNREEFRNGDAMVSYDAKRGWGAAVRVPVRKSTDALAVVTPASKELLIGADVRCPTGTSQIVAALNVLQQSLRISGFKKVTQELKINFAIESSLKQPVPKVGLDVAFE
jgi:hypothetical protein